MVMRADSKWSGALVRDRASGGICLCCLSTRNFSIFSYCRVCSIEWVGWLAFCATFPIWCTFNIIYIIRQFRNFNFARVCIILALYWLIEEIRGSFWRFVDSNLLHWNTLNVLDLWFLGHPFREFFILFRVRHYWLIAERYNRYRYCAVGST